MAKDKATDSAADAARQVAGEENAPITTLAIGEEHVITTLVGEHVQASGELAKAMEQAQGQAQGGGTVTTVVGEAWYPPLPVTTLALGEESATTFAVGEEESQVTTKAIGEEGPVTTIVGEQSSIAFTTTVVGEEGPVVTTLVGEQHQVATVTTVVGEDASGGTGGGGAFGKH